MILAVVGLAREAKLIARPQLAVAVGGGDSGALRVRIEAALADGATRIISTGVCGALSPSLKVGDCIVATKIVTPGETLNVHGLWARELLDRIPVARPATLAGADTIVSDGDAKTRMHRATGAAAVDMESHVAAKIAQERGLPFAAFRVVSDTSQEALPPAALIAMSPDGGVNMRAVFQSLAGNPLQIPALIRTAWNAEKAFRVLFRSRHILDPMPASMDFGEHSLNMG